MKLNMLARSDIGTDRAGANASRLAVTTIRYMYLFLDPSVHQQITRDLSTKDLEIASRLVGSIRLANRNVYNKSIREPQLTGMGTTVSALAIREGLAIFAHVGDSRIYRIRQDTMTLLTEDHTWLNELIQDQEIDAEQAKNFQKQNVITRALGLSETIKIDVGIEPIQPGDLFLICSDGLTKAISDDEMKRIVLFNRGNLNHTLHHLIDTANMKDGSDNITVALISIEECEATKALYSSIYLTLSPENKQTMRLENKILNQELYNRTTAEWSGNNKLKILKHKYMLVSTVVAAAMLVIFIGVYAFSSYHQKNRPSTQNNLIKSQLIANTGQSNSAQAIDSSAVQKTKQQRRNSTNPQNRPLPDSVINKLVTASFESGGNRSSVSKVRSRPLKKNLQNRGRIYLTGLEKLKNIKRTLLYINNNYWGKTETFWNKGLLLRPGMYTITIRDSSNRTLYNQKNIKISAGDIKLIEIKGR